MEIRTLPARFLPKGPKHYQKAQNQLGHAVPCAQGGQTAAPPGHGELAGPLLRDVVVLQPTPHLVRQVTVHELDAILTVQRYTKKWFFGRLHKYMVMGWCTGGQQDEQRAALLDALARGPTWFDWCVDGRWLKLHDVTRMERSESWVRLRAPTQYLRELSYTRARIDDILAERQPRG